MHFYTLIHGRKTVQSLVHPGHTETTVCQVEDLTLCPLQYIEFVMIDYYGVTLVEFDSIFRLRHNWTLCNRVCTRGSCMCSHEI